MSHFTRIKTKLVEKKFILNALDDLGYAYKDGGAAVSGWRGDKTHAEIKVSTKTAFDIGFVKSHEGFDIVADWYGTGVTQQDFLQKVNQRYAYHATRTKLEEQGFSLVSEENQKDGKVHLVVRRVI